DPAADDGSPRSRAGGGQAAGQPAADGVAFGGVASRVHVHLHAGGRVAGANRLVGGFVCGGGAGGGKLGLAGGVLARKDLSDAGDQRAGDGVISGGDRRGRGAGRKRF